MANMGVDEHEGAAVEVGRGDVFDADLDVFFAALLAVGTDKGAIGVGEHVEEAFVEGEAGAQDGADDNAVVGGVDTGGGEGRFYGLFAVGEGLRHFEGHGVADATEVLAEPCTVFLDRNVAKFGNVVVDDGVVLGEIDDFHDGAKKMPSCSGNKWPRARTAKGG